MAFHKRLKLMRDEWYVYRDILIYQDYFWLWKRIKPNSTVIDLGGSFADTASYFAMNPNVKRVISFEANSARSKVARENLKNTNPEISRKIEFNERGIWSDDELNRLIAGIKGNIGIKCDIDDPEHQIFTKRVNYNRVYAIMIEYDFGVQNLRNVLEGKGYSVEIEKSRITKRHGECGFIKAFKK